MPRLHDASMAPIDVAALQARFAAALLADDATPPAGLCGSAAACASRFAIYRNNVAAGLVRTLERRFPVVARLVGDEFFRAMAHHYVTTEPPASPVLLHYGAGFPAFLAGFEPVRELPYLPDVARLEWLHAAAHHAADAPHAGAVDLAPLADTDATRIRLGLHASAALFGSAYPAVSIWETNARDEEVRPIGPEAGDEQALIVRRGLDVDVVHLDAASYALAEALRAGATLADAAEATSAADADASIPHALARLVACGAIGTVTVTPAP